MLYKSKHWNVAEWDCLGRTENEYAWTEDDCLCTDNENTANLFKILDMLRDWNPNWQVNTTKAGYHSGFRTIEINEEVGGEVGSYHTRGSAADICISNEDDTDEDLANTVLEAAKCFGLEDGLGIGYYGDWVHVDYRGYTSRW